MPLASLAALLALIAPALGHRTHAPPGALLEASGAAALPPRAAAAPFVASAVASALVPPRAKGHQAPARSRVRRASLRWGDSASDADEYADPSRQFFFPVPARGSASGVAVADEEEEEPEELLVQEVQKQLVVMNFDRYINPTPSPASIGFATRESVGRQPGERGRAVLDGAPPGPEPARAAYAFATAVADPARARPRDRAPTAQQTNTRLGPAARQTSMGAGPAARQTSTGAGPAARQASMGVGPMARQTKVRVGQGPRAGRGPATATSPMVSVPARHMYLGGSLTADLLLPKAWVQQFKRGSVLYNKGNSNGTDFVGRAKWKSKPDLEVAFAVWRTSDHATWRHVRMSKLLGTSRFVPALWELRKMPMWTFLLSSSPGSRPLAALIAEREEKGAPGKEPLVPLKTALPLMVDMLRGVLEIENAGLVHLGISEDTVYIGDDRAIFSDLRGVSLAGSPADADTSQQLCAEFRGPPEMAEGEPTEISNSVWQLGLVFARMIFGGELPTKAEANNWELTVNCTTAEGRRAFRTFLRDHFVLRANPAFDRLGPEYTDVRQMLFGMLMTGSAVRWSVRDALAQAVDAATARGITVNPPPPLPESPPGLITGNDGVSQ